LLRHQISNTFGNCANGSAAAPTTAATIAIRVWLMQRLLRIWLAIHSRTLVSTPLAFGAQLSLSGSGDSATVRGGTARPDADAAGGAMAFANKSSKRPSSVRSVAALLIWNKASASARLTG